MTSATISKDILFENLDIEAIAYNDEFKEDSVREAIILPILKVLGYKIGDIVRSKTLEHPYLKIASKKRKITYIPDYILKVSDSYAWVLDAKAPNEQIVNDDNVEQVYCYATHPEVRSTYFALCNGLEFAVYRTNHTDTPILYFRVSEIENYWNQLMTLLSPSSFHVGKEVTYDNTSATAKPKGTFNYNNRPLLEEIPVKKQEAKRHFGVHGYFTKQSWNVVAEYIRTYSKEGDTILDPFGGSGVTAVEAIMNNRKGISIDLNPMAVFMVNSLIAPVKIAELTQAFNDVIAEYKSSEPHNDEDVKRLLKEYQYPKGIELPKASDVKYIEELFSDRQLAELALLKHIIKKQANDNIRNSLLLAFSSSVNKHNLTFHYTKSDGGGDSGAFRYYRYRIAPQPGEMPLSQIFETKFKKVIAAKKDIANRINAETIKNIQVYKGTATDLSGIANESVDYIYTDPPYGSKIPYLDLSVMWTSWLDLEVTEEDYEQESIVGGEHNKSKDSYNDLMSKSIREMYRVLKFDRWMSFVFAHKDPEFWHLIVNTAESCGLEYMGAVPQKNGQSSFKKRQHPFTVLSGQLIINFRKVKNPKAIMKANLGMDITSIVMQTVEGIIAKNEGATIEQINDELIIKGLELGFLDLLKKQYSDIVPVLKSSFDYDPETEKYSIKKDTKFTTHLDVRLRIRYYVLSYLRRMERENKTPHFDDIILYILPLLKNGTTPENQTILGVLDDVAERVGNDCWKLRTTGQVRLFD